MNALADFRIAIIEKWANNSSSENLCKCKELLAQLG
jgi:hypothetical protein